MELVPAGIPLSFEVTFDSSALDVGMTVYDDTGAYPDYVTFIPMILVYGNTYRGKFTAQNGKSYILVKAVYTDDTFTDFNLNYSQGSESIYAKNPDNGSTPNLDSVIGYVEPSPTVVGFIEPSLTVVGFIEC